MVKIGFGQIINSIFTLRAWEKRQEKKKKGGRTRFHQERQYILVEFIAGDPYGGMGYLSCWINSSTHQYYFIFVVLKLFI